MALGPACTCKHMEKESGYDATGEKMKPNDIKVESNANKEIGDISVNTLGADGQTSNGITSKWTASMTRGPQIDSGALFALKMDRYDMTEAPSGSHERLDRARHGGTLQMKTLQRRQDLPTSVPRSSLLQSRGYTRYWRADQLEPPHPMERSE
jgi:hypothetical protein